MPTHPPLTERRLQSAGRRPSPAAAKMYPFSKHARRAPFPLHPSSSCGKSFGGLRETVGHILIRSALPRSACHKTPEANRDCDGTHGGAIAARSLALREAGSPAVGAGWGDCRQPELQMARPMPCR